MLLDCPHAPRRAGGLSEGMIENMTEALIVVDVQNDFCSGGALAVPDGETIVPLVNRLMARFEVVVATQDWHPADHLSFADNHAGRAPFENIEVSYGPQTLWPAHCVQNTPGAELHADLEAERCEMIVRKGFRSGIDSYSAFMENDRHTSTGLAGYLRERGVTKTYLCGLAGDVCVYASTCDAQGAGFEAVFVEDCVRDIDLEGSKASTRADLVARGIPLINAADLLA